MSWPRSHCPSSFFNVPTTSGSPLEPSLTYASVGHPLSMPQSRFPLAYFQFRPKRYGRVALSDWLCPAALLLNLATSHGIDCLSAKLTRSDFRSRALEAAKRLTHRRIGYMPLDHPADRVCTCRSQATLYPIRLSLYRPAGHESTQWKNWRRRKRRSRTGEN